MGTIVATVTSGLHATATKTYNLPDSDIDRLVLAYQVEANASINATATYAQVLLYIFNTVLITPLVAKTATTERATAIAAVAPIIPINPV